MNSGEEFSLIEPLTGRERQILRLLSEGLTNREIGQRLHLSHETIKWYNKRIYEKLGVGNRTEAAATARERGLLEEQTPTSPVGSDSRYWLPAPITTFLGREEEIRDLKKMFGDQRSRWVTLTGLGGIGKTRLALEVARRLSSNYRDGALMVNLAQVNSPSEVPRSLAAAFGLELPAERDARQALAGFLHGRNALVVFDNFEHLVEAAPLLVELLSSAPELGILVTSRQPLSVYGEVVYQVPPLSLPPEDSAADLATILGYESAELFVQRAKAAKPSFELNAENVALVARICNRLQGLPLAIELAAAGLKQLDLEDLDNRLSRSLADLGTEIAGVPDRQRTLGATIGWSYELLDPFEKALFSDLSVFQNGFTMQAAEQVVDTESTGAVRDGVQALVEKGLLVRHGKLHAKYRFSMLEVIHEFARALPTPAARSQELKHRHARYYTQLVEASESSLAGPDQTNAILELQAEDRNIHAALEWALSGENPELGLRLVGSQSAYWWYLKGFSEESLQWVERALQLKEQVDPAVRAGVETIAGHVLMQFNQFDRARNLMLSALAIYENLGNRRRTAWLLASLSFSLVGQHDRYQEALGQCERSIEMFTEMDDPVFAAAAFNIKGHLARSVEDYETAKQAYTDSLQISREHRNMRRESLSLVNIGIVEQAQGDARAAIKHIREGLKLSHQIDHPLVTGLALAALSGPLVSLEQPERAAQLLGASLAFRNSSGTALELIDEPIIESYTNQARASLGDEAFHEHFGRGEALDRNAAVDLVLESGMKGAPGSQD